MEDKHPLLSSGSIVLSKAFQWLEIRSWYYKVRFSQQCTKIMTITRESKKQDTLLSPITLPNFDRFSIFFTNGLSSKRVMKRLTIPQVRRYTTL